jgi:hypothetical protein
VADVGFFLGGASSAACQARAVDRFPASIFFFSQFIFSLAKFCAGLSRLRSFHPPLTARISHRPGGLRARPIAVSPGEFVFLCDPVHKGARRLAPPCGHPARGFLPPTIAGGAGNLAGRAPGQFFCPYADFVMAGPAANFTQAAQACLPAIHVFAGNKAWMPGMKPGMTD